MSYLAASRSFLLAFCLAGLPGLLPGGSTRAQNAPTDRQILARRVNDFEFSSNFGGSILQHASDQYGFPIGLELEPDAFGKPTTFRLAHGTVEDLLNGMVNLMPAYKWTEDEGVINVMPRERADSVLDVRIHRFQVRDASGYIGQAVASIPEIKAWLQKNGLTERTPIVVIGVPVPLHISVDAHDETLRQILNSIVRTGQGRCWSVWRYGNGGKALGIIVE